MDSIGRSRYNRGPPRTAARFSMSEAGACPILETQAVVNAIMVQGTGSDVGKSVVVCGLCRSLRRAGVRVAPFKSQNMALNSCVTADGLEMGRAQVSQAEAARLAPRVDMNPILLKPSGDAGCQVIVMGKPVAQMREQGYYADRAKLWRVVEDAYQRLAAEFDVVVIEGAGSPAEINLRDHDIVNMRVAKLAMAPVLLVVDIDRGGAFAWVAGTLQLLAPEERALVKGVIVNKFRGDVGQLEPGLRMLEDITGVPVLGVVPYFRGIHIDAEDSVCIERVQTAAVEGELDVVVVRFPGISNFTDFDALASEPGVRLRYVQSPTDLGRPDLVVLPGTKNTCADLRWLRHVGFEQPLLAHARAGGRLVGICGGFQMLGRVIRDPERVESQEPEVGGLGLLPVVTTFLPHKTTHQVKAVAHERSGEAVHRLAAQDELLGYEIHMGTTTLEAGSPLLTITQRSGEPVAEEDGAVSDDGRVWGTYLHGLFDNDDLRFRLVNVMREAKGLPLMPTDDLRAAAADKERSYEALADLLEESLDMDAVRSIIGISEGPVA